MGGGVVGWVRELGEMGAEKQLSKVKGWEVGGGWWSYATKLIIQN